MLKNKHDIMEPENIRKFIIDARNGGQSDVNIQIYLTEKHGIENAASYFVEKKKIFFGVLWGRDGIYGLCFGRFAFGWIVTRV